ncbi:MAG TPA: hypothetical protein VGO43_00745 [Pyrinomonadaceae bacterium]|jgi:hypothetical protein|nr:hypothetical protein [Pyrinomonadaceae bacterium]
MAARKIFIPLMLLMFLVGASVASGQDWKRLGEKDVDFHVDHDRIIARDKGGIREVHFSVKNAPVKFSRVVINYKNGEKQEVEFLEDVQLGGDTRSITIEGNGRKIDSLDVWYETDSLGGKKAKVTAYGRG